MEKISISTTLKRNPEQIFSTVDQDIIMLSLEEGKYFALNEAGARIWELMEHPILVETLINKLLDEFEVSNNKCNIETLNLLNELHENKLVILC